jgi:hypothetical protein
MMSTIFDKLNLKDQEEIVVLNAPKSFESEIFGLSGVRVRRRMEDARNVVFALAFVTKQIEVDQLAAAIAAQCAVDPVFWFAYPKGTSKRFSCEFNRDNGWGSLRKLGFDTVRQVAIDEDWSALRFRRVEFIKQRT